VSQQREAKARPEKFPRSTVTFHTDESCKFSTVLRPEQRPEGLPLARVVGPGRDDNLDMPRVHVHQPHSTACLRNVPDGAVALRTGSAREISGAGCAQGGCVGLRRMLRLGTDFALARSVSARSLGRSPLGAQNKLHDAVCTGCRATWSERRDSQPAKRRRAAHPPRPPRPGSHGEVPARRKCASCTVVNHNMDAVACEVCGAETGPAPAEKRRATRSSKASLRRDDAAAAAAVAAASAAAVVAPARVARSAKDRREAESAPNRAHEEPVARAPRAEPPAKSSKRPAVSVKLPQPPQAQADSEEAEEAAEAAEMAQTKLRREHSNAVAVTLHGHLRRALLFLNDKAEGDEDQLRLQACA
jgi:hypothetical protein